MGLRAPKYLHNHNAASISLSQIASDLGVHRGHLASVLRAAYGETLGALEENSRSTGGGPHMRD